MCSGFKAKTFGTYGGIVVLWCSAVASSTSAIRADESAPEANHPRVLHIAADPNNLPFSNQRLEGFENKIAALLADDLHARLEYTWHAQRRGFFRETLKNGDCELVMGVPSGFERALTTKPYYRSSYTFVSRHDRQLAVNSLDDPRLRQWRVGVQLVGNDGVDTPPAHALANRGVIDNVVGFTLYGDYREESPPARIIDAVAQGKVDVALVWGPLAGYYAQKQPVALDVVPVSVQMDGPVLPLAFDISIGVRRRDKKLRDDVDDFLVRRRPEIERILDQFGVPRVPKPSQVEQRASLSGEPAAAPNGPVQSRGAEGGR